MKPTIARATIALVLIALALVTPAGTRAQTPPPNTAPGISSDDAKAILQELRQIRQLLERMQAPPSRAAAPQPDVKVKVGLGSGYALGKSDAPLTMVEFTDYECPFCRQFHLTTFEELKRNYVDTGKLRYVSRDFPLDFHRNAMKAAVAARCAADQGRFWELRHTLIVNAQTLSRDSMVTFARDLRLDADRFASCLDADRHRQDVQRDIADGHTAGVDGTPTFVVGRTSAEGVDGVRIVGAHPYAVFDAKIRELLAGK
jgi:protein-disulfide isomerase